MKILISPAKSLDYESKVPTEQHSNPFFLDKAVKLNESLRILIGVETNHFVHLSINPTQGRQFLHLMEMYIRDLMHIILKIMDKIN